MNVNTATQFRVGRGLARGTFPQRKTPRRWHATPVSPQFPRATPVSPRDFPVPHANRAVKVLATAECRGALVRPASPPTKGTTRTPMNKTLARRLDRLEESLLPPSTGPTKC
jgi:hypothetical protein